MAKKGNEPPKFPEIGQRLTQFIEQSNEPNARQFALKAGLAPQLVSNLAAGYSMPSGETLIALTAAFKNFEAMWLLTGKSARVLAVQPSDPEPTDRVTLPESLPHQVLTPRMVAEPNLDHLTEAQQIAYWKSLYQGLRRQVDARDHEEALRFAQPARRLAAVGKTSASSDAASPAATACAHYNLATGQRVEEQQLAVAA